MKPLSLRTIFLLLGFVVAASLLSLTPRIWSQMDKFMVEKKTQLLAQFESGIGLKIAYRTLSPNILEALEFQEVNVLAPNGEVVLHAASVRFRWNWWALVTGKLDEIIQKVQVINASVDLDAGRDQDLITRLGTFLGATGQGGAPATLQFEGFNVAFSWKSPTETVNLDRGFFQFEREQADYHLLFRGGLQARFLTPGSLLKTLRGQFEGDLRTNAAFDTISVQAKTSQVVTNLFQVAALHIQLKVNPDEVELVKVQDSLPFDFRVNYDRRRGQTQVSLVTDHFQPDSLVTWKGSDLVTHLLATNLTGQFSVQLSNDLKIWSARASGEAGLPAGLQQGGPLQDSSVIKGEILASPSLITFHEASFESPVLGVAFDGTLSLSDWLPTGHLVLTHWHDDTLGDFGGEFDFTKTGDTVQYTSPGFHWQTLAFDSATGWFQHAGNLVAGSVEAVREASGIRSVFTVGGKTTLDSGVLPLTFHLDNVPLSLVQQELDAHHVAFSLPQVVQGLVVSTQGVVNLGPRQFSLLGIEAGFSDPAEPRRSGLFSADFQNGLFRLKNGSFHWDDLDWTADLQADLSAPELVSWQVQLGFWGQKLEAGGLYARDSNRVSFSGTKGLGGEIQWEDGSGWHGQLKIDDLLLPGSFHTAFDIVAEMRDGVGKYLLNKADLQGVYPWNGETFNLQTKGQIVGDQASFTSVSLKDSHNQMRGTMKTNWNLDFASPWVGSLNLLGASGIESVLLDWRLTKPDTGTVNLTASRLDLGRWVAAPFRGRLGAKASVSYSPANTAWNLAATVSEAFWGDSPIGLKFNGTGTLKQASFSQIQASIDPLQVTDGTLAVNLETQAWTGSLPLALRFGPNRWTARLGSRGTWKGTTAAPVVDTVLEARQVTQGGQALADWTLSGSLADGLWKASLADGSVSAQGDLAGKVFLQSKMPFPIQGQASGVLAGGKIQLQIDNARTDLTLLRNLTDKRLLDLKAGVLTGSFTVSGILSDPEIQGQGSFTGLVFDTQFIRQTVGPVTIPIEFLGRSLRIPPVNIGPKGQVWSISGTASLDHLLPQEYLFTLETDPLSFIPFSYQATGINARGGASGLLTIKGNPISLLIGGRMVVQDAVVTQATSPKFGDGGDYFSINSDLTLVTGRNVEYLAPSETLPLLRAVTNTNQVIVIHWNEPINDFDMHGTINFKTGEINYLNQTFVIKQGQLIFKEDENTFDPRFSVRAELRKREDTGPVTITLKVDGTLANFQPQFESSPHKSPEELQQLIGSTLTVPAEYVQSQAVDTALSLASDVGTTFLLKPFEDSIKKNFSLDLFTVKTEILKKTLLRGNTPLDASGYLDNTSVFFGKYIGDDLFLQGSLAFRKDTTDVQQATPSLLVEPEISMEFQTPFFLLNWTLQPQHPETLFVSDNTVTFSWNWSY